MIGPESQAAVTIKFIHDRLERGQQILEANIGPQTEEERVIRRIIDNKNSAIARKGEAIIDSARAKVLVRDVERIHDWMVVHAPSLDEMPSHKEADDHEGWVHQGGGFYMTAEVQNVSGLTSATLLDIKEREALLDPPTDIYFTANEGGEYGLLLEFGGQEFRQGVRVSKFDYNSEAESMEDMPEDDAVIVEDLLARVKTSLGIETNS